MGDLYPTKTRLSLLDAIDKGKVFGYPHYDSVFVEYRWGGRLVNARIDEVMRAGWAQKGAVAPGSFRVELTEAGRKVLEAGRG